MKIFLTTNKIADDSAIFSEWSTDQRDFCFDVGPYTVAVETAELASLIRAASAHLTSETRPAHAAKG